MKALVVAGLLVVIAACSPAASTASSPPPHPTAGGSPGPTAADGAEALVADLNAGGAKATIGSGFLAEPLPGEGVLVCVGAEAVQVYLLKDHEAALAAARTIDARDPSRIGTSIVDWAGRPRFWLRDRIIVLYVGDDAATDVALRHLLGLPFAEAPAAGRPPLPGPDCA